MKRVNKVHWLLGLLAVALAVVIAGCGSGNNEESLVEGELLTNKQLHLYNVNQPIKLHPWSQYRQTLLEVEDAQAEGVATTSFMMNLGRADPIESCPSVGYPLPSTAQLTNPDQAISAPHHQSQVVAQAESNGIYTGESTGTYVTCVAPNGTEYINYWEGFVYTVGGPAHWDYTKHEAVLDGAPTVVITENAEEAAQK